MGLPAKSRIGYIETMRGLACLLLVSFHVIGLNSSAGLRLPDDHFLRAINGLLADSRMPLFSFISGFVFSAAVAGWTEWRGKTLSKVRRLLVPFVVVSTLHYALKALALGEPQPPIWLIYVTPYEHFWFIPATFMLMAALLTTSWAAGNAVRAAVVLLVAFVTLRLGIRWLGLHDSRSLVSDALYLAPYFLAGHLFAHWLAAGHEIADRTRYGVAVISAMALAALIAAEFLPLPAPARDLRSLATGLATCSLLMMLRWNWWPLAQIGAYSYAIYLFHVMFTAGARTVLTKLFAVDPAWLFLPCLLAGVVGPMLLSVVILRSDVASFLLLGIRRKKPLATPLSSPSSACDG